MKVNRTKLLEALETVAPGLTARDVVEQSACFAFKDGDVYTFNDEVACRRKSPLDFEGAVQADPLLQVLRRLPEDTIHVDLEDAELIVRGKNRKAGIRVEENVVLPIDKVEAAEDWKPLHEDFADALFITTKCAGKDESMFANTCIHFTPKCLEACDNDQAVRYKIKLKISGEALVRAKSLQHIIPLGMTEIAESETWMHFRNATGLVFSCRRSTETFEEIDSILDMEGEPLVLPKGLGEAATKAEIFASENQDTNEVVVELKRGKLRVLGEGVTGWYSEVKKVKYKGPAISFRIDAKLLNEVTQRYNECEIAADRLRATVGKFVYCVSLNKVEQAR